MPKTTKKSPVKKSIRRSSSISSAKKEVHFLWQELPESTLWTITILCSVATLSLWTFYLGYVLGMK